MDSRNWLAAARWEREKIDVCVLLAEVYLCIGFLFVRLQLNVELQVNANEF